MEERNLVEVEVAGKKCDIWQHGSGGPVILWGMYPHEENGLAHMQERLGECVRTRTFCWWPTRRRPGTGTFRRGKRRLPLIRTILQAEGRRRSAG